MAECPRLSSQPQSNGELLFDAPWQARAFAMAVTLNENGVIKWSDWAERFSQRIAEHESQSAITDNDTYYRLWLDTLESWVEEIARQSPENPT